MTTHAQTSTGHVSADRGVTGDAVGRLGFSLIRHPTGEDVGVASQQSATSINTAHTVDTNATAVSATSSSQDLDLTPPTSSDGLSSQSQSFHSQSSRSQPYSQSLSQPRSSPSHPHAQVGPMETGDTEMEDVSRIGGQKRTASGTVKQGSASSRVTSPVAVNAPGHSRHTSLDSTSSKISELSTQLRARLSYALVKVQHGWEAHSLGEVESIASNQSSPTSMASLLHHGATQSRPSPSPRSSLVTPTSPGAGGAGREGASREAGRTYESFWRDHGTNTVTKLLQAQRGTSLQPAPSSSTYASTQGE
ncbi:MAG: hypothetical protein M1838_001019 [Thelocarpon superellum]|nr:MAG: hypothetical protein M1838_001019 [Thelocarpon superellum]